MTILKTMTRMDTRSLTTLLLAILLSGAVSGVPGPPGAGAENHKGAAHRLGELIPQRGSRGVYLAQVADYTAARRSQLLIEG